MTRGNFCCSKKCIRSAGEDGLPADVHYCRLDELQISDPAASHFSRRMMKIMYLPSGLWRDRRVMEAAKRYVNEEDRL